MSILTRTDVTAVKLYKNFVLAGIGSNISIFDKTSHKLLQNLHGLYGQKIYGFVPTKDKLLVFGGKQFTVIALTKKVDSKEVFNRQFEPVLCDDWLHSGVWVDEEVVALLTAHNVVQKWNISSQAIINLIINKENSILYSGLLLKLEDDVLVLAGTVFSEVLVHRCGKEETLHHLRGHKGVIFSISCDEKTELIVTTSDDRSLRIWGPNTTLTHPYHSTHYWENIDIVCKHEVYGHLARVMRNCIIDNLIVSVGEDSAICYWDLEGKLLKKAMSHQNSCIWSVDANKEHLVTGGGDGGVIIHPLTIASDYSNTEIINIDIDTPKKVAFTSRQNIVVMDDINFVYYNVANKRKTVTALKHESTYKLLALSNCKQIIAVADMKGKLDVFIETCKDDATIINIVNTTLDLNNILSMQWAGNRHLVFSSENGIITVIAANNMNVEIYAQFVLPTCKERWLTSAAIDHTNNKFVVGDRCGNIHVFTKGQSSPVKSFSKVHGRYGPTSISVTNDKIITTGRNGRIKYFNIKDDLVKYMNSKDLPFEWVEKFLDSDENVVCGFQERDFVVYNVQDCNKMLEVSCGGGHRSWDAIRYIGNYNGNYEEFIKLIYLKNADINVTTFQLSKIVSRNIVNGSHSKEINCLKAVKAGNYTLYISGGEDTTLRISSINSAMVFQDEVNFKHLSSIRTLQTYSLENNKFLLISAGGRAQMCIKEVTHIKENDKIEVCTEELVDFQIRGTDKEKKGNQTWRNCTIDFDPEMRIMDLDVLKTNDSFIIFAGCSDAYLRVFKYDNKRLEVIKTANYHATCILKTRCISLSNINICVTGTTRGEISFWDADTVEKEDFIPFFSTKTNKSGINSFSYIQISKDNILIATGGDDNAIHLILLEITKKDNLTFAEVKNRWNSTMYHSSEITGISLVDNFLLSTSIDQRITLLKWRVVDDNIECEYLNQIYSDIADIQRMDVLEDNSKSLRVYVFGKGMEILDVPKLKK